MLLKEGEMTFVLALALQAVLATSYTCEGVSPEGKYAISLEVVQQGDNYLLLWAEENGSYGGFGILVGDQLAGVFVANGDVGVILYEVKGGELHGVWTIGDRVKYTEVCKPANARAA